jgi:cobalt-zinc-cadmium efflux system outer membrane protein
MSSNAFIQRRRCTAFTAALVVFLAACPSVADDAITGSRAGTPASPVGTIQDEAPQRGLTLRDALALAVKQSPDLASFSWEIRAREARALQAGLRPNPTFSAELENIGGSGPRGAIESA